jgi:ribonucleotide monophosphatase NagD (HAD superfamily)
MIYAKAFLIDLDGVLYVERRPVPGAKECLWLLEELGYPNRFVSNTTSKCRETLAKFLGEMGFDIPEKQILTPAVVAAKQIGLGKKRRCYLLSKEDLQKDRYWMASDGLNLAAGPFAAALEYATRKDAVVVGKPRSEFFQIALGELRTLPEETAMIGDDINTDVGGAKRMGILGILVKTGKYSEEALLRSRISPDFTLESIADLKRYL